MKNKFLILFCIISFLGILLFVLKLKTSKPVAGSLVKAKDVGIDLHDAWASSENLAISIHTVHGLVKNLTGNNKDYKPSWSRDGRMLTFFRLYSSGWQFKNWRTKICVINADGSGFRELTSGEHPDFNPTWTRDGSNRVIFNRYSTEGGWRNQVYWTSPYGSPGDEQLISDPSYPYCEWATGALKDGRIFVDRFNRTQFQSFLLTPAPGKRGNYEEVKRPTALMWHKLTVSPGEKKVAYMLDHDRNTMTFNDAVICYAYFDVNSRIIKNQKEITALDYDHVSEYPCWNGDESLIFYDSNISGTYQLYAYRLKDGVRGRISTDKEKNYQFISIKGLPK